MPLPHASLWLFSRQEYTAEKCGAVQYLKLIGLPVAGHFCIHMLLLSARVSRYENDSQ